MEALTTQRIEEIFTSIGDKLIPPLNPDDLIGYSLGKIINNSTKTLNDFGINTNVTFSIEKADRESA